MHYKLFSYELTAPNGKDLSPDDHDKLFERCKGRDDTGNYTEYRGKKDALLMYIRVYGTKFIGLVGRRSNDREVVLYDEDGDETFVQTVEDEDYPHAAFICFPRIRMIACVDGAQISAQAAMARLHRIIGSRTKYFFVVKEISQPFDLRKATQRFRITQVNFEILPVNPHSGDLGLELDASRKLDHIKKIKGTAEGSRSDPLKLEGGFLTAIQQLQASGHCRVGFHGITEDGVEVQVPKPSQAKKLSDDTDDHTAGEEEGVRIKFPSQKQKYPFSEAHVLEVLKVAKKFLAMSADDD
jgi:hypothetical protein